MKPEVKGAPKAKDLTVAEIMKLGETDPNAADAALQRIVRAREAREAEAHSQIGSVEDLLGDSEIGAGEALDMVEDVDELDVFAGDAPIAKTKGERAEPTAAKQDDDAKIDDTEPSTEHDVLDEAGKRRELPHALVALEVRYKTRRISDQPYQEPARKGAEVQPEHQLELEPRQ